MTSFTIIGLGKMGGNMARRLVRGGVRPALFDQDAALTAALSQELNCVAAQSPTEAVTQLTGPRIVWLMLPSGATSGKTQSYSEIAATIGKPKAARAVGSACGANPIPVLIPCHRVLAANKKLGGFSGGLNWKRALLKREGIAPED